MLANEHLRATLSPDGTVVSLVCDGREALAAPANRLELYEDEPTHWEAWDIDPAHLETGTEPPPARSHRVEATPLRAEVVFDRDWITQTVRLDAGSRHLSVHLEVNWQLDRKLLKVAFPLAVRATEVTYEVAFGAVQRPTHYSSRADLARYEVPGHRWADMSEHGFGVAVLTDSKYGYSAFGNTLRISLLRAPRNPDPDADRGTHTFAYALLPHTGSWQDAGVVAEAAAFNSPMRWGSLPPGRWRARPAASCSTRSSAPRTQTRWSCASTSRTAAAASRACGSRRRVPSARTSSRSRGDELAIEDGEILVPVPAVGDRDRLRSSSSSE